MRRGLLGGLPVAALVAAWLACAPAASARDVTITSFDGTKIVAHWFVGKGVNASSPAPTILEGPGWSMPGDTNTGGGAGAGSIFGVPGISGFLNHGYNVLTWDPRGFGQSGGTVQIDDPRYEGRDVQALLDWVAKQPEAQLDQSCTASKKKRKRKRKRRAKTRVTCATSPNDPTVGMAGASYGGGIQNVTAGLDKRVDAIAPTIAWNSLISSLFPEGNIKLGWGSVLVSAGVVGSLPGGLTSPATAAGRQDPHFYSILTNGVATGTVSQGDHDWMASKGPGELLSRIQVPTLILQGTVDTLFTLDEAVANFERIGQNPLRTAAIKAKAKAKKKKKRKQKKRRRQGQVQRVPVKMIWFCGGHGVCLTGAGPGGAYLDQRTLAWFDRYLRGKAAVDTGPKFAWIADDGQLRSSEAYPLRPSGRLSGAGSGTLPILPGAGSGALIFATQAANAVNVPVSGPSSDANVVGAPHLELTYQGTAVPQKTWIYAQFVNPRNGTVLGNMATPISVTLDGQQRTISRDLELVAARAPAGGGYTLQLTPSSSLFDIQRSAGVVDLNAIDVTMPLGDPVAAASSAKAKQKKKKKHKRKGRR
jgi:ABC-2 type transport system ATP-binding protein